jgi:hypothetical protein
MNYVEAAEHYASTFVIEKVLPIWGVDEKGNIVRLSEKALKSMLAVAYSQGSCDTLKDVTAGGRA